MICYHNPFDWIHNQARGNASPLGIRPLGRTRCRMMIAPLPRAVLGVSLEAPSWSVASFLLPFFFGLLHKSLFLVSCKFSYAVE